jgi:hypothetical protein
MRKTKLVQTLATVRGQVTPHKIFDVITNLDKNQTPMSGRTLILNPSQYYDILSQDVFVRIPKATWVTIGEIYGMKVIIEL